MQRLTGTVARLLGNASTTTAPWVRYLVTVALIGVAVAARLAMMPVPGGLAFVTFYPVIIVAALLFGTGPAIVATVLAGAIAQFAFLPPFRSLAESLPQVLSLATFALTAALTCLLAELLRRVTSELRDSEQRLRGLYEVPHIGIVLTDKRGRFVQFNEAFCRICGYTTEELQALDFWALTPLRHQTEEARQTEILYRTGHFGPFEKEYVRKDGSLVPLQLNGVLLEGDDGESYVWSLVEDITERKQLEHRVAAELARNQLFLRMCSDGAHILDAAGTVVEVSDAYCRMMGYARDELIGMHPSQLDAHLSAEFIRERIGELSAGGEFRFETINRRKDGTTLAVEVIARGFDFEGKRFIFCSARDMSEQRRLERAVLEATDREQRRLGHDLHDGLGQELTGLSMLASALATTERKAGRPAVAAILQFEKLTRQAIATCRAVARGLSPLGYASGGLVEALHEMVTTQQDAYGTDASLETSLAAPLRLGAEAGDHLYRIAQEAVTNARRHAGATQIRIRLRVDEATLRLEVEDDGTGIPPQAGESTGMGFRIMQFRARMLGGQLSIRPGARGGTLVVVDSPQSAEAVPRPNPGAG